MGACASSVVASCCRPWSLALGLTILALAAMGGSATAQVAAVAPEPTLVRTGAGQQAPIQVPGSSSRTQTLGEARAAADDAPTVARITMDPGRTTFEGTGLPSTLVELSEGGQLIGVAPVDVAGRWVMVIDRPLAAGDHRIATTASDPSRAKLTAGQDVLLSIPEGFTGTTVLSQRASAAIDNAAAGTPRSRVAEQSAIAQERFSEVMSSPEWRRIAQATTPPPRLSAVPSSSNEAPRLMPVDEDGSLGQLFGWFDRASRDYHELVVKRLAYPRPLPTEGLGASRAEAPPAAPKVPQKTVQAPPPAATAQRQPASPPVTRETTVLESLQGMLARAGHDYHEGIIRKLAQSPEQSAPSSTTLGPAGPAARVGDPREAEALRRADADRRAAEARRLAELAKQSAASPVSEQSPRAEDRAAIEARRLEAEQRMAAARRADEERRAEEARLEGLRRQAEAAKRAEDEKRAAELAKAEEARRSLEAAQRDAQRSSQEAVERQRQAALEDAQRKALEAQRADEARRSQEAVAAAAAAARKAQEETQRLEAQRLEAQKLEAQRVASAKAAEEERRRAAAAPRPVPETVAPVTPRPPSGFRTDEEYRRAMAEAARAPKETPETTRPRASVEAPAKPTPTARNETPAARESPAPSRKAPTGFSSEEAYRRALIEASRAPKAGVGEAAPRTVAAAQPKAKAMSRAEAERAAREMLKSERARVAELRSERDRKAAERKRAEELRIAAAAPKVIDAGQVTRRRGAGVVEEGSSTRAAPDRAPSPRKEERRVAECPAAGRRVSLPGTYVVKNGDTLWKIADRFYGDGDRWERIARANKGKVPNPDVIGPCLKLILPRR